MFPAKITFPKAEGGLARERLFDLLDASPQKNIVWVSAPAGSGKTTLISSYLETRNLPCLWYQVDEGDEDIASFFYYMGLAARAASGTPPPVPLLTPEYLAGLTTFARRFFAELYNLIPRPFALVFDNYQQASPYALIHQVLKEACSMLPAGVSIFFLSRHEPAPVLAASDFMENAKFLTWNEIRFSFNELHEMVRMQGWDGLDGQALQQLYARTDGWAAGLLLMLESLGKTGIDYNEINSLGSDDIFGYFAEDLFRSMDAETRVFLMKTSVLPELSVSLAERLTGIKTAEQILSRLHRNHFFIGRHGGPSPVYQYHPLFREFLLFRMHEKYSAEEGISLRRKAAQLMEESFRVDDAAQLFIEASDWESLTRLILRSAQTMVDQGRSRTLHGWIKALPRDVLNGTPWLWYWKGISLMPFDAVESQRCFETAFENFASRNDRAGLFLSWAGIADINIWVGEFRYLDEWIEKLEAVMSEDGSFPSPAIEEHITLSIFNALSFKQPHHPDIARWSEKVFNLLHQKARADSHLLLSGVYLGAYYLWAGHFAKATLVADLLAEAAQLPDVTEIVRLSIRMLSTTSALFVASPEQCLEKMRDALQIAETSGIRVWNNHLHLHGMTAAVALGDQKLYRELERNLELAEGRRFDKAFYSVLSAWQAYLHGENEYAATKQGVAHETIDSVGFFLALPLSESIRAEILYAGGERARAEQCVASALERGRQMGSILGEYWCHLLKANMALDSGRGEEGLGFLRTALTLGRKHSFEKVSIWVPSSLTHLCTQALEHDIETDYVRRLIRERRLVPADTGYIPERWPYPLKIYTLGNFTVHRDGVPLGSQGKSRFKLLELLRAIIALGGRQVSGSALSDILWPDADGDAADSTLGSSLHRLRKLLGSDGAITVHDGRVTLNPEHCWVDAWAFRHLEAKMEKQLRTGQALPPHELSQLCDELLGLYRGAFLADAVDESWAAPLREKLMTKFVRLVISCGRAWEDRGEWNRAGECYQRGIDVEPFSEELYRCLISCCIRRGYPSEAVRIYQRCCELFSARLGVAPSAETRALVRDYLNSGR